MSLDDKNVVTVCARCLMACCWQGQFMCDEARGADTTERTVAELKFLDLEHPEYWDIDKEHGVSHRVVREWKRNGGTIIARKSNQ